MLRSCLDSSLWWDCSNCSLCMQSKCRSKRVCARSQYDSVVIIYTITRIHPLETMLYRLKRSQPIYSTEIHLININYLRASYIFFFFFFFLCQTGNMSAWPNQSLEEKKVFLYLQKQNKCKILALLNRFNLSALIKCIIFLYVESFKFH